MLTLEDSQIKKVIQKEQDDQQMTIVMATHRKMSYYITFVFALSIIKNITTRDYFFVYALAILLLANIAQYYFFKRYPSIRCLQFINFCNIILALFRIKDVIKSQQGTLNLSFNQIYYQGLGYMAIHMSLLVNSQLRTNIIVLMVILAINTVFASIIEGRFYYESLILLVYMTMYAEKIRQDILCKEKLSQFQLRDNNWDNIFKNAIMDPFILIQFNSDQLKFNLIQLNDQAQRELLISDSISMRQTLRNMKVIFDNCSYTLEKYILEVIKSNNQIFLIEEDVRYTTLQNINKIYETKIFQLDAKQQTYIITFHNQVKHNQLKKIILDQQMTLCTILNQQYALGKKILKTNKKAPQTEILLRKNQADLINQQEIFRTQRTVSISSLKISTHAKRIGHLFPKKKLLYVNCKNECQTDQRVLYQILLNLCSFFFDYHQCHQICLATQLQKSSEHSILTIRLTATLESIGQKYLIQKDMSDYYQPNSISQIQKKSRFRYLISLKLLAIISPYQKIIQRDFDSTKHFSIEFSFYQNMQNLKEQSEKA